MFALCQSFPRTQIISPRGAQGEHEATSEDDAEHQPLSMRTNDIVEVVDRSNPDWWFGTVRDAGGDRSAVGYFPAVMVRPYGAQAVAPPDVATALGADVHRTEVHSLIPKIEVVDPAKARDRSPPSRERSASFVERPPALFGAWLHSDHPLMGMIEPGYAAAARVWYTIPCACCLGSAFCSRLML